MRYKNVNTTMAARPLTKLRKHQLNVGHFAMRQYRRPDSMDDLFVPQAELALGPEIARGANGAVHEATLYGGAVCAKVGGRAVRRM